LVINNITLPTIIKKDKIVANNINTFEPPFSKPSNFIKSGSVSAFPQPQLQLQQPLQVPKFGFNNASFKQQSNIVNPTFKQDYHFTPFEYKPPSQYPQPTLAFSNFVSQAPLSQRPDIK
jgi:hypothetical protein